MKTKWYRNIVLINIVPIIGVLFFKQDLDFFINYYILETIVIGIFMIIKLFYMAFQGAGKYVNGRKITLIGSLIPMIFISGFLIVHFGGFSLFMFGGVNQIFREIGIVSYDLFGADIVELLYNVFHLITGPYLFTLITLLVLYLHKFLTVFIKKDPNIELTLKTVFLPYTRIFVLHGTIMLAGFSAVILNKTTQLEGTWIIIFIFFLVLKTYVDYKFQKKYGE